MSATPDSTLADPQQIIANLRRELGECRVELDKTRHNLKETTTERDEALAQQTATAEVLQVINSSPGDLAPVFDAMLEKAMRLCGAAFGFMTVIDGERSRTVASRGVPAAYAAFRERNLTPANAPISSRVRKGEPFIHTIDLKAERFYEEGDPQRRAIVDLGGARTLLATPLMRDQAVLGAIQVYRTEVRPFSDKQIALLQNFAAQAVIAMENARLLTETREALEQQTATAEVLGVINSSPGDKTPVFKAILEKARVLCGAAHGSLSLYDGERFRAVAINTRVQELEDQMRQGFLASDFPHLKPLLDGARFVHVPDLAEIGNPYGARTGLFMPLRKDNALLGLIVTVRLEIRPFSDKEIALLENFAAQAVIAMENARLLTETREALEQQTATAEVLGVINSSPGDLAPVFEAILERAHSLCGIDFGALQLQEAGKFRSVAARGLSKALVQLLRQPYEPVRGSPPSRLLGGNGLSISRTCSIWRGCQQPTSERKLWPKTAFGPGSSCRCERTPISSATLPRCGERCGFTPRRRSRCSKISRRRR